MTNSEAALLIVDDNEDNRYTLTRRLSREGYQNLTTANNGREALECLVAQPFDLVLLDVMMPDMNGYEVLEHVKANASLRDIPIIMISALDEIDSVIRCIELGAEDYLNKPFNPCYCARASARCLKKSACATKCDKNLTRLEEEMEPRVCSRSVCCPAISRPVRSPSRCCTCRHAAGSRSRRRSLRLLLRRRSDLLFPGRRRVRQRRVGGDVHGARAQPGTDDSRTVARMAHRRGSAGAAIGGRQSRALPKQRRADVRHFVLGLVRYADRSAFIRQCRPSAASYAAHRR